MDTELATAVELEEEQRLVEDPQNRPILERHAPLHGAVLLLLLLPACRCTASDPSARSSATQTTEASDANQKLVPALSEPNTFNHTAKVCLSDGNTATIALLRKIVSLGYPTNALEAEDVRNDARALLARLLVGENNLEEAMIVVREGLGSATRDSFSIANLHTVEGEIHEARAAIRCRSGAEVQCEVERHSAIDAFEASIRITQKLQEHVESK